MPGVPHSQIADYVTLLVEPWIKDGIATGEYYLQGGVVRKTTGTHEIVKWLKPAEALLKEAVKSSPEGLVMGALGFGLMQINFLVVMYQLHRIEKKLAAIEERLGRIEAKVDAIRKRQDVGAFGQATAGCQLAHEAMLMLDPAARKQQLVMAKGHLIQAEVYFDHELSEMNPTDEKFSPTHILLCQIRLAYVRVNCHLGDFEIAKQKLDVMRGKSEKRARAVMSIKLDQGAAARDAFARKYDNVNELIATAEHVVWLTSEVDVLKTIEGGIIPYFLEEGGTSGWEQ